MLSNRVSSSCSTFYRELSLNNLDFIACETPRWVCLCPTAKWHRGNGSRCSYVILWKQEITRYSNRLVLMRRTIDSMGVKSVFSSSSQKRQIFHPKKKECNCSDQLTRPEPVSSSSWNATKIYRLIYWATMHSDVNTTCDPFNPPRRL